MEEEIAKYQMRLHVGGDAETLARLTRKQAKRCAQKEYLLERIREQSGSVRCSNPSRLHLRLHFHPCTSIRLCAT